MQNTASSASSSSSISSQSELSPSIVNNLHNASAPVEILKRPAAARKKRLEDDPWTADVSTVSVNCLGCGHLVRLSTKSLYDNHHWLMHKQRCKRAGNIKDNPDIGQSSPRQPAVVQTKSKSKPKLNRKAKVRGFMALFILRTCSLRGIVSLFVAAETSLRLFIRIISYAYQYSAFDL
ncbi:hypothetical protein GGU10DRAFT_157321 [Lentinula aff. detonsa]|uniref:Uncharacterized protein n=1 Tax=Lentinula aff. detonsa TaxID=2804958 RepID=A0AA38KRN9_9AGAR|nr:hypothetical protein GGU10DRAFT_157321 [Lentinula aff. detonsa]